ncbi:GFA family protein [Muricoccus radiodurans]|uniref:GFA family protein n=1 Tax=Muricoccus radiodurans TaxID=2231721 RepID=UPI003CE9DE8C
MSTERRGACNCGAVRIAVSGAPKRVGLCHCLTCQREVGGPFIAFAVWPIERARVEGQTRDWGENAYRRSFCPGCGSRIGAFEGDELEVRLGVLDDGGRGLVPEYELWVGRRQPWVTPVPDAAQHEGNRPK